MLKRRDDNFARLAGARQSNLDRPAGAANEFNAATACLSSIEQQLPDELAGLFRQLQQKTGCARAAGDVLLIEIDKLIGCITNPANLRRYGKTIKIQLVTIGDVSKHMQGSGFLIVS